MVRRYPVTTVILAGGLGRRMGGDKGLKALRGKPLIEWVIAALRQQGTEIVISANDNTGAYAELGFPVLGDVLPGHAGPLAGVQAAMRHAGSEWVASVPCDTPYLPGDLIARLFAAAADAEAAVAVVGGRRQPSIALYRKSLLPRLSRYLEAGNRKAGGWLDTLRVHEVAFEDERAFVNINSLEELEAENRAGQ